MKLLMIACAIIGAVVAMPVADVKEPVKEDVPLVIADYSSVSQDGKSALESEQVSSTAQPVEQQSSEAPRKPEEKKQPLPASVAAAAAPAPAAPASSSSEESSEEKLEKSVAPIKESEKKIDVIEAAKKPAALAEESSSAALNLNAPIEAAKDAPLPALKATSDEKLKADEPAKVEKPVEQQPAIAVRQEPVKEQQPQSEASEKSATPVEQPKTVIADAVDVKKDEKAPELKTVAVPAAVADTKVDDTVKTDDAVTAVDASERVVRDAQETKPVEGEQQAAAKDALLPAEKPADERKPLPAPVLPKPAEKEQSKKDELKAEPTEAIELKKTNNEAAVVAEQKSAADIVPAVKSEKPADIPAPKLEQPVEQEKKTEEKSSELPAAAAAAAAAAATASESSSKSESS